MFFKKESEQRHSCFQSQCRDTKLITAQYSDQPAGTYPACPPTHMGLLFYLLLQCCSPLLKLMSTESAMLSNLLIFCCPLLLLPSMFLSIRVFSDESALHIRCPKYRCFSFSISPPNKYSRLISCRIYWLVLLAAQGTLQEPSLAQQFKSIRSGWD